MRVWRENGVDTVLAILAADGDRAYNFATVNTTLAAGSRPADRVRVCQGSMEAKGAKPGYTPDLGGQSLPRGKVMYGMARQCMRDEARDTGTDWSIQDGKVQMVPRRGYLPGEAVVLTHETGLVGSPEQTQDGISVRCLLNPRLRVGGRIRLNTASVKTMQTPLKLAAGSRPRGWMRTAFIASSRSSSGAILGGTIGTPTWFVSALMTPHDYRWIWCRSIFFFFLFCI